MDERWRQAFLERSMTPDHRRAVREAEDIIRGALERAQRPYVAFSGGKDSTVMAHLVLQQRPGTMVWHWDFGPYMPASIRAEVIAVAQRLGAHNLRIDTTAAYEQTDGDEGNLWARSLFGRVIPRLLQQGYDLGFIGIRSQESGNRRRRIRAGRSLTSLRECWPISSWSWLDVWAYIVSQGLPWVSVYDREAEVVGWDNVRFSDFFGGGGERVGADAMHNILHWKMRHQRQDPRG